eukprot:jgi/Botrbrau1/10074/Bobra.0355s0028.2
MNLFKIFVILASHLVFTMGLQENHLLTGSDAGADTHEHLSVVVNGALQMLVSRWASQLDNEIAPLLASATKTLQNHAAVQLLLFEPWQAPLSLAMESQPALSSTDVISSLPTMLLSASTPAKDLQRDLSSPGEDPLPQLNTAGDSTHVTPKATVRRLLENVNTGKVAGKPHQPKHAVHAAQGSTPAPEISPGSGVKSVSNKGGAVLGHGTAAVHSAMPPSTVQQGSRNALELLSHAHKRAAALLSLAHKDAQHGKAVPQWGPPRERSVAGTSGHHTQETSITQHARFNASLPLSCSKPKQARSASAPAATSAELMLAQEIEDSVMKILQSRRTAGTAVQAGAPAPEAWSHGNQASAAVVSEAGSVNATCVAGALAIAIAVSAFGPATASAEAGCGDAPCPPSARRSQVIHAAAPA